MLVIVCFFIVFVSLKWINSIFSIFQSYYEYQFYWWRIHKISMKTTNQSHVSTKRGHIKLQGTHLTTVEDLTCKLKWYMCNSQWFISNMSIQPSCDHDHSDPFIWGDSQWCEIYHIYSLLYFFNYHERRIYAVVRKNELVYVAALLLYDKVVIYFFLMVKCPAVTVCKI